MGMTIGIDLGTTNSVMCIKKMSVSCIRNAEGEELTPSCVTAVPDVNHSALFNLIVGRHSRDLLKQYPEQTILSIKRLMGRDFEDSEVQKMIKNHSVSYAITTEASEFGSIRIPLADKLHTPEMISGIILRKLIDDGEKELQGRITQAVVTVPAYFSDRQKFATRAACDYAGIQLLRLLPEPTAAALSFGLELGPDEARTLMVFDLGGGTFDISVLNFSGGSFMEITKGGDMWLGGDDIDPLLVEHVFAQAQAAAHCTEIRTLINHLAPIDKARFLVEIKEKAEAAKIALSSEENTSIELFGLLKDENNRLIDIDVTITQAEFSALISPIVERVVNLAKHLLHEIHFEPELIDTVLLVGGSSSVPAIQDALKALFGADKVQVHPRPMLAIAEGAALMAAKLANQTTDSALPSFSMMHSTAHDYYLQLAGGKRHLLVARNTPLPVRVEEKLTFSHPKQALARLRVLNEVDGVWESVGELWFHKANNETSSNRPETLTELMLRFSVDEDNIITMKAWSVHDEQQSIETPIARGGLSLKLYNDLENTLSFIVANSADLSIEQDALALSRFIIPTILSASDPVTGETRLDQKQKAERQIETLRQCQENEIAPLCQYEFAKAALTTSVDVLSETEYARLTTLVQRFKQAIDALDEGDVMIEIDKALDNFYKEVPIAAELGDAECSADVLVTLGYPKEAKQIREQAKKVISAYVSGNEDVYDDALEILEQLIHSEMSNYSPATRRFDREVSL